MRDARPARSHRRTLRVQADVPHTFGTLLVPLTFGLLAGGVFLVERPLADPLGSGIETVLLGSVVLASGLLLAAFLVRSVRISALSRSQEKNQIDVRPKPLPVVRRTRPPNSIPVSSRSSHRRYEDQVRISL